MDIVEYLNLKIFNQVSFFFFSGGGGGNNIEGQSSYLRYAKFNI